MFFEQGQRLSAVGRVYNTIIELFQDGAGQFAQMGFVIRSTTPVATA